MRDITVLLTAAGSAFAPGMIRSLKNNGERQIRVVGVDMSTDPTIRQMCDVVRHVPRVTAHNYVDTLLQICKEERVDVLLPWISDELLCLRDHKHDFAKIGTIVSVSDGNGVDTALSKIALYEYMDEHGFDMPKFHVAKSFSEFEKACREIGYPEQRVVVKLKDGSGSRGIRIIDPSKSLYDIFAGEKPNSLVTSYENMVAILQDADVFPELLIMAYLPGKEYSVDLLADHGKTLYIVGRDSNIVNASIPQEATLTYDEEAYAIAERIVDLLMLDGNVDLDFKWDANGHPCLMEINPRMAATLSVITAGGCNLPYLRIKQLLGESLPEVDVSYGVKMKRRYGEYYCDEDTNPIQI